MNKTSLFFSIINDIDKSDSPSNRIHNLRRKRKASIFSTTIQTTKTIAKELNAIRDDFGHHYLTRVCIFDAQSSQTKLNIVSEQIKVILQDLKSKKDTYLKHNPNSQQSFQHFEHIIKSLEKRCDHYKEHVQNQSQIRNSIHNMFYNAKIPDGFKSVEPFPSPKATKETTFETEQFKSIFIDNIPTGDDTIDFQHQETLISEAKESVLFEELNDVEDVMQSAQEIASLNEQIALKIAQHGETVNLVCENVEKSVENVKGADKVLKKTNRDAEQSWTRYLVFIISVTAGLFLLLLDILGRR
mmetsp:Transcript_6339/g.9231  ORF Transcript_6339/g.9231 Transcript_6339/m.9231 type:complete len:300 (+) Transcript_6339:25-924(+)